MCDGVIQANPSALIIAVNCGLKQQILLKLVFFLFSKCSISSKICLANISKIIELDYDTHTISHSGISTKFIKNKNSRIYSESQKVVAGGGLVNICVSVFPRFTACFSGIIPRFVSRSVGFGIVRIGFEL